MICKYMREINMNKIDHDKRVNNWQKVPSVVKKVRGSVKVKNYVQRAFIN